jgi:hypothetical protein
MKGDLEFVIMLIALFAAVIALRGQIPGPTDRDQLNQLQIEGNYER